MDTTLVGVFKKAGDAKARLAPTRRSGCPQHRHPPHPSKHGPGDEAAPAEGDETTQDRGAVKRFFIRLFDRVYDAVSPWLEPQTSDHFVLTVVVADARRCRSDGFDPGRLRRRRYRRAGRVRPVAPAARRSRSALWTCASSADAPTRRQAAERRACTTAAALAYIAARHRPICAGALNAYRQRRSVWQAVFVFRRSSFRRHA